MNISQELSRFCKTRKSEVNDNEFEKMRIRFCNFMDSLEAKSQSAELKRQNEWCRDKMNDNKYSDPYVAPCNNDMITRWAAIAMECDMPFTPINEVPEDGFSHAILATDNNIVFDVPNLLHYISDSAQIIESKVRSLPYVKRKERDYNAEKKMLPIAFVSAFYRFVLRENRLPDQEEFFKEFYLDLLLAGVDYDRMPEKYKIGLKNRICSRTYPSVIRDIHFCKLLAESLPEKGYDVLYNTEIDIKGIDVLIREKATGELIGVCLFIDTKKSNEQIEDHKIYKRRYFKDIHFMEFPIQCDNTSNGIWLYDKNAVKILLQKLQNKDYLQ